MARLVFVLVHSTDAPERAASGLALAAAAQEAGHEVALWLNGEATRLAVAGVAETMAHSAAPPAPDTLADLARGGATLHACAPDYDARGFGADQLRASARRAAGEDLAGLVADGWVPVPT